MRAREYLSQTVGAIIVFATGLLFATPAAAQLNQPLHRDGWILAAAHAPGLQGSIWRTDIWVVADSANATITLELCRSGEDGRDAETHVLSLTDGDRVMYVEDVIGHFLDVGSDGWVGAIHYTASVDVQVWARVYSISPDGTKSYGQIIAGQATANASPDDDPWNQRDHQWMYAVRHTADGRFRVNVGVVNPSAIECQYWVAIYDTDGNLGDSITVTVPARSMMQLNDPFAAVNGGEWSDYEILIACTTEGGSAFAYASVVDNATNDAYFVRGVKGYLNASQPANNNVMHNDGWILAAAHSPGLQGSIWRTDLWFAAPQNTWQATVELSFHRAGEDGSQAQTFTIDLTDGPEVHFYEDVVEHFLGVGDAGWLGAIHYTSDNTNIQVWARVYSVNADGTASYGQLIEGIPTADMSPDQDPWDYREQQYVCATKHTADGRFRVNFGIVNPTGLSGLYVLDARGADGNCPPQSCPDVRVTVPPYSMVQLNDPFGAWQGGDWSAAQFRLRCITDGAGGFLYASVVDNATNDAFFVRGIKLLTIDGS